MADMYFTNVHIKYLDSRHLGFREFPLFANKENKPQTLVVMFLTDYIKYHNFDGGLKIRKNLSFRQQIVDGRKEARTTDITCSQMLP